MRFRGLLGLLGGDRDVVPGDVGRCARRDDLPDAGDGIGAPAGGEQTVVADAVEAVGQDVEQEAADELVRRSASQSFAAAPWQRGQWRLRQEL